MEATKELAYRLVEGWEQLPKGYVHRDVSGVATDSDDRVYLLTRGEPRVLVYERDGRFVTSFAEGLFTDRTHGITIGPDDSIYCVDDADHTIRKFTPDGKVVMTLGTSGFASDTGYDEKKPTLLQKLQSITRGGPPFNRPTNVAVAPNGDLYVSDGYGNARVHRFSADGKLIQSWGEPGTGPGQFTLPHGIWVSKDGRVFVADRENDRIQIFDLEGKFLGQWTDVQRPTDICIDRNGLVYVSELAWWVNQQSFVHGVIDKQLPGRVSVFDLGGRVLQRWGGEDGCAPGNFWAPHSICVDSHGDIYVGEVVYSFSGAGKAGLVPAACHTVQKFVRK